jgi:hypothetical protein
MASTVGALVGGFLPKANPVSDSRAEDKGNLSSPTPSLPAAPLPKTKFFGKTAPRWVDQMRAELTRPGSSTGTLVSGELKDLPDREQQKSLDWVAKKAFHQFKQDDDRYTSKEATKEVIKERAYSDKENERVFVSGIRYRNLLGKEKFMPVSSVSLVEWDSPKMPKYGPNWGADFVTKARMQGRGLATDLIQKKLTPATDSMGGFKLYSEPQNAGWYKDGLKLHKIDDTEIDNQEKPGEKIPVTIFSSQAPKKDFSSE